MLEGNIFASGGHGSSSSKRWGLLLLAVAVLATAALAGGGIGGVVNGAVNGITGASGAESTAGPPAFSGSAVAFVFLLVGMLVVILRM